MLNILAVGDVFGEPGCEFVRKYLRRIKNIEKADLVIVNAENATTGSGTDPLEASLLFTSGADVLTGGNHSFRRYTAFELMDSSETVLRPLNFPPRRARKGLVYRYGQDRNKGSGHIGLRSGLYGPVRFAFYGGRPAVKRT